MKNLRIAAALAALFAMLQGAEPAARDALGTGAANVKAFGASGDGIADDTAAIQAAIESAAAEGAWVYFPPGTYTVSPRKFAGIPGVYGRNSVALFLKSGSKLSGPGTIKLKDGTGAGSGAVLGTADRSDKTGIVIEGLEIDCNGANTRGKMSGISLLHASESRISNVFVHDCKNSGMAIKADTLNLSVAKNFNNIFESNLVKNVGRLAIQTDYAEGVRIIGNRVVNATGNCIGVYSDDTGGASVGGDGTVVMGNSLKGCLHGIFFESGGEGLIVGNVVDEPRGAAIYLNSGHATSRRVRIADNWLRAVAAGTSGLNLTRAQFVDISGNYFEGFDNGIVLRRHTANNHIGRNLYTDIKNYLIYVERARNRMVRSLVARQVYTGAQSRDRWPKTYYDPAEPVGVRRYYAVTFEDEGWSLQDNRALNNDFHHATLNTRNRTFAPDYARFVRGETRVDLDGGKAMPAAGDYLRINGTYFRVHAVAASVATIRDVNDRAGDYTPTVEGGHQVFVYTAAQYARLATD